MKTRNLLTFLVAFFLAIITYAQPNAWINEIHYDNDGTDVNEAIEVVVKNPGSLDLSLLTVILYNGSGGASYDTDAVSTFTVGSSYGNYTVYYLIYAVNGLQNGSPDGVALSYNGTLIQFLSYEGTFTATNGDANGVLSTDIGVSELGTTTVGYSLQLGGTGSSYDAFSWQTAAPATLGTSNNSQTIEEDLTAPSWTTNYPSASNIAQTTLDLTYNMDEPGMAYYVVLADGAAAPTSAEVKAGTASGGGTAIANGSQAIAAANTDYTSNISGLTASTLYDIYVVAEDDEATPNLQAAPVKVDVTMLDPDVTAPSWTATYPKTANVANNDFDLLVSINEIGKAYYVVLADGTTAPNSTQVKAGQDGTGTAASISGYINITTASTEFSQNIAGLTAGTTYDVYVVAEDAIPNLQASPAAIADVTTTSIKPEPSEHVTLLAGTTTSTSVTLTWTDAAGAQVPDAYLVLANTTGTFSVSDGTAVSDDTDFADNAGALNIAQGVGTCTFNGLTPGTTYYFRVYSYTNSGASINYKTDGTIPQVTFATPKITVTTPNGGERYYAGDNVTITWTSVNMDTETIKFEAYIRQGLTTNWGWEVQESALSNTGTLSFQIPADATYGTQYKIRLTGNTGGAVDSSDAPFTIIATPSIYQVQSQNDGSPNYASFWANDTVRIAGIVTGQYSTTTRFFVQDSARAWNGIYVYNAGSSPAIGDSVWVKGKVTEFNGLTEIAAGSTVTVIATGEPLPSPIALSTLAVNDESYESVLVKVTGATCNSGSSGNYVVNDGSGDLVVYKSIYSGLTLEVGRKYDITGIVGWYNTTSVYQLYPRSADDIYLYSNNDTLSDLKVDGTTVTGFDPATLTYNVVLPYGTTTVPTVTYTLSDPKASAVQTDAGALPGATTVQVTAEDGSTQTYTINFTVAAPNTEANILTFTVAGVDATIDAVNHTVTATVPYSTDITDMVATFTLSAGATAKVGTTVQESGVTTNNFTNPVVYTVTAEDGTTTLDWTVTITKAAEPSHEANITAYSIDGANGTINSVDHTIALTLPYGTDVTNLVATFTLSTNATAKVGGVDQVSGTTANNFTNPLVYTVTAEDGTTTQDWTVTVTVTPASTAKDIISFTISSQVSSTIDAGNATVTVVMPYGTSVTSLTPTIEVSEYATISPASGVAQDFTNPVTYTVTAQDNSTKSWTVTVTVQAASSDATVSSSVYTVNSVDGTITNVPYNTTLSTFKSNITPATGATFEVYEADGTTEATDLQTGYKLICTAQDGITKKTYTITLNAPPAGTILVAWTFPNNPDDAIADEGIAANLSREITCTASGTVAYNVSGVTTYAATNTGWDNGVDTKYWMVEFTTQGYKDIKVSSAQRSSSTGPRDFKLQYKTDGVWTDVAGATNIVVTSDFLSGVVNDIQLPADCNDKAIVNLRWVVTSTTAVNDGTVASTGTNRIDDIFIKGSVSSLSTDATVTSTVYTVDSNAGTITDVPLTETLANFKANITPAAGATFEVYQSDGTTVATDLQTGYKLICTAEDGVTKKTYTITLNTTLSTEANILSYSINSVNGTINSGDHTIALTLPYGTNVTSLVATFTLSPAATAKVGTTVQESGVTSNDFTNPVVYTVTAEDGTTTQNWTVTVTVAAPSSEKDILTFNIPSQISSTVDAVNATVAVVMPLGTNLASLTPTITVSQYATISPASGVAQDFTNPVTYTVTAQDNSTKVWTVTVTVQDISLISIYSIQYTTDASGDSPLKGQQVYTTGVVTAVKTGTTSFNIWIQDSAKAWNGVYVYGINNSMGTIVQGDSVEVIGTVDEYSNLTEVKSVTYLKKINSGNTLPTPVVVTPAEAATEAYEGVLVQLTNVECTNADAGYGEFTVSDGTNTINIDDFLYKFTPTQGARYNITGVVDYGYGAFKVQPRSADDIESAEVTYTVTFTVKRADGTTPVADATITVTGQGNVTTDANGQATMQLPDGNYSYVVTKTGFDTNNGNFTVNGADLPVNITLIQTGIPANPIAKLSVYPNPFNDRIYFTGAEVTRVTITSVIGQVVLDRQVENAESIDVGSLDRGIYLVRFFNSKGETVLRKLVKE